MDVSIEWTVTNGVIDGRIKTLIKGRFRQDFLSDNLGQLRENLPGIFLKGKRLILTLHVPLRHDERGPQKRDSWFLFQSFKI